MRELFTGFAARGIAAVALVCGLALSAPPPGEAQSLSPLPPRWSPLGPDLLLFGQASGGPITATGRANAVAPNPLNRFGDVWVGSATGGVWHGSVSPFTGWQPMTDQSEALAVGDIELDSCTPQRCATVWVGTGENGIRRDTQYGKGILKGAWNGASYDWTLLGEEHFALGAIARLVLDPRTPDNASKTVFVALSSGLTANATQSTVYTRPPGSYGIWRSRDAGETWANVLATPTPATDLEMDPQAPDVMWAGVRRQGLYKSTDGGDTWQPSHNGIPAQVLATADWPEIEVFRKPGMPQAILYAVFGECPHPHEKQPIQRVFCEPIVYRSHDSGASWFNTFPTHASNNNQFQRINSLISYTHGLTIHPSNPNVLWYGGVGLWYSFDGGVTWLRTGGRQLHVDQHQLVVWEDPTSPTGTWTYAVSDGGFYVGDGFRFNGLLQNGIAVTQFQSISSTPWADFLIGGTQDNGTNLFVGGPVWQHIDGGDAASTEIDLDNPGTLYDVYVGTVVRRCALPNFCFSNWPEITEGIPDTEDTSWYSPVVQDSTAAGGQHPLYFATHHLYRSTNDGQVWDLVTQGDPLGGSGRVEALNNIRNPITAVAVAPSNRNRIYIGYYDGQVFTTTNAWAQVSQWKKIDTGLPGRPVTSIAVHPLDDRHVLASFTGFAESSVFVSTEGGASWSQLDASAGNVLARAPVNILLIEPQYPHRVWAGTDEGVWMRSHPNAGGDLWTKSAGLPNVAVYDLVMGGDGESVIAGTHGRGIWRFSSTPVALAQAAGAGGSTRSVAVSAAGFDPGQSCTMTLLEGSRVCGSSTVDAGGAGLATDSRGFLVTAKAGAYGGRALGWACQDGSCAGGIDGAQCDVSEVRVTCGGRTTRASVAAPAETLGPQSTSFGFEPAATGGSFTLTAKLRKRDGTSVELCSHTQSYAPGESDEVAFNRAANAMAAAGGPCRQAGVRAAVTGFAEEGIKEDEEPQPFRIHLEAPRQLGTQLITEVSASGAGFFTVHGFGAPTRGRAALSGVAFSGTAAGGRVEVTERSLLGSCTFALETTAGESAEAVAERLQAAFLAPEPASPAFQLDAVCLPGQNPRDAKRSGAALRFALGSEISVNSTDAGLGFTIGSGQ